MSHLPKLNIPPTVPAGGLLSPESNHSELTGETSGPPAPDLGPVSDLLNGMRDTVLALSNTFDSLQNQSAKVAEVGGTVDAAQQIHALRKQLVAQDKKQEEQIEDLKALIQEILVQQIAVEMGKHLRDIIREKVVPKVRERVAEQLQRQFPDGVEEQLASHRVQLNLVRQSLQNAESRRMNALIKSNQLTDSLQPLLKADGKPSPHLPPHLAGIFQLPDKSIRALMEDYGIPFLEDDSRERRFNRIMQFLGIAFQMVPTPKSKHITPLITST